MTKNRWLLSLSQQSSHRHANLYRLYPCLSGSALEMFLDHASVTSDLDQPIGRTHLATRACWPRSRKEHRDNRRAIPQTFARFLNLVGYTPYRAKVSLDPHLPILWRRLDQGGYTRR